MYATKPKKELRIEFVKHRTAQSVVLGFFRPDYPAKMSDKQILKQRVELRVKIGKHGEALHRYRMLSTFPEVIEWVRGIGVWGYCKHFKHRKEIHYWIGVNACRPIVIEFILHEMMHVGGIRSEGKACRLAGLAAFAMQAFESDFDGKMPFQTKWGGHP